MGALEQRQPQTPAQQVIATVRGDDFRQQIQMALPPEVSPDRFTRIAVTALMQDQNLASADRASLYAALIQCAQMGLLPDKRQAALVTYKGKVTMIPMVGGYRDLAAEYGWDVVARVVYDHDDFEYSEGFEPQARHLPARIGTDRGDRVAAYAIAIHRDGRRRLKVMAADEIAKHRAKAQTQNVWNEWPDQMWAKTAAKALCRELPLAESDRIRRLLADEVTPSEAAAALYGPSGADAFEDQPGEASVSLPQGPAPAGDTAGEPNLSPGSPADDDYDYQPIEGEIVEASPATRLAAAADAVVPTIPGRKNPFDGKTLAQVFEDPAGGAKWIRWALEPAKPWWKPDASDEMKQFAAALRLFADNYARDDAEGQAA